MLTCSVANCKSSASDVGIRFFKIPNDYNDRWKKVINRADWTQRQTSKICSLHFSKDSIKGNKLIPGNLFFQNFTGTVDLGNGQNNEGVLFVEFSVFSQYQVPNP